MNNAETEKKKREKAPKPKFNMWQNSAWMISIAWRYKEKKVLVIALLQVLFYVINTLIGLYITPTVLAEVESHAPIWEIVGVIAAFAGGMMLVNALNSYVNTNAFYGKITVRSVIISLLNKKASTTSYPNMGEEKYKELETKSTESTDNNRAATEGVWNTIVSLLQNIICFIIYLVLLSTVNVYVMLIITATSLVGYFVSKRLNEYEYRHRSERTVPGAKIGYVVRKSRETAPAKDIRIFGLRPWLTDVYTDAMRTLFALRKRAEGVYIWSSILSLVLTLLRNGIAYSYLINLALSNGLSVSEFLLYFSAVGGFASWVNGILRDFGTLHRQSLDISSVREFLEYKEPFKFDDGEPLKFDEFGKYEIRLENVSFRYPNAEKDALSHINLTLRPGEKVAVVGLNGAGKTTLVKLICGLYDPTEGRVLLNGRDIRDYNRRDYYKMFSAVFQNFSLMAVSVAANVAQTEDNIDFARVKDCISKAGLTKKIESLPEKYESKLNREVYDDATTLSGGETQRLMLARALYKNAPFLILDEPTAALDPIAESDMYNKYNEIAKGRTSVYISHRLASTRFCDRILFISDAVISEEGTHDELMRTGGGYAKLFAVQSKYYKEGADNE